MSLSCVTLLCFRHPCLYSATCALTAPQFCEIWIAFNRRYQNDLCCELLEDVFQATYYDVFVCTGGEAVVHVTQALSVPKQ